MDFRKMEIEFVTTHHIAGMRFRDAVTLLCRQRKRDEQQQNENAFAKHAADGHGLNFVSKERMRNWLASAFLLLLLASLPAAAHPAWGIVVAPNGDVYFSDLLTVWRLGRGGRLSVAVPAVEERHVHELELDARGNLDTQDGVYRDRAGHTYALEQNNNLRKETRILRLEARGRAEVFAGGAYGFADGAGARAQFRSIVESIRPSREHLGAS